MEKESTKRVPIIAADDKCQITAVFAGTLVGNFLPPQLIYNGTTTSKRCLPTVKFPSDWHITCSDNYIRVHDLFCLLELGSITSL